MCNSRGKVVLRRPVQFTLELNDDLLKTIDPFLKPALEVPPCLLELEPEDKDLCDEWDVSLTDLSSSASEDSQENEEEESSHVRFGTLRIRYYDRTIGDHPRCSEGIPVSLDWTYSDDELEISVDEYESLKDNSSSARSFPTWRQLQMETTKNNNFRLNKYQREHILTLAGYSEKELKAARKQIKIDKRKQQMASRMRTVMESVKKHLPTSHAA